MLLCIRAILMHRNKTFLTKKRKKQVQEGTRMDKINALLSEVKKCTSLHESKSREAGEDFNVYKLCGIYHNENPHSDILAEFLDPKGSHGCGCDFFRAFCQTVGLNFSEYENAKVVREYAIEGGRFDILIEAGQNKIVIENKIYAGEGEGQLAKYREWLDEKSGQDAPLFFLTLDGRDSAELPDRYTAISYKSHIILWLTECIRLAAEKPSVRESLIQYRNLIEELTKGNAMSQEEEKIVETIQSDFQIAITVAKYLTQAKAKWFYKKIVEPLLDKGIHVDVEKGKWEQLIRTGEKLDCFISYQKDGKKVLYAYDSFNFHHPRREIITNPDLESKEIKEVIHSFDLPHAVPDELWGDEDKANSFVKSIIADIETIF